MGNAMDLLISTQSAFTADEELGTSESISYTHKESTLSEDIRAFVSKDTSLQKEKRTRGNYAMFSNVILEEEPMVDDTILYNGVTYKVLPDWQESTGMYIIYAENNKRHNGRVSKSK